MPGLKRRAVQERMPDEVARRAEKGGVTAADWYAGREVDGPKIESEFAAVPPERAEQLDQEPAASGDAGERRSVVARIVAWGKGLGHHKPPRSVP
jgi:hypothetical protein